MSEKQDDIYFVDLAQKGLPIKSWDWGNVGNFTVTDKNGKFVGICQITFANDTKLEKRSLTAEEIKGIVFAEG